MASSKRDQLINTAQELFYREGYHATGIDRILAESGVAKMTLYKHFRSKDELIQAVLQSREQSVLGQLAAVRASAPAREAVLQVFEGLHAWINQTVDIILAVILMAGGVIGVQYGARVGARIRSDYLRLMISLLIVSMALRLAIELITPPADLYSVAPTEETR